MNRLLAAARRYLWFSEVFLAEIDGRGVQTFSSSGEAWNYLRAAVPTDFVPVISRPQGSGRTWFLANFPQNRLLAVNVVRVRIYPFNLVR